MSNEPRQEYVFAYVQIAGSVPLAALDPVAARDLFEEIVRRTSFRGPHSANRTVLTMRWTMLDELVTRELISSWKPGPSRRAAGRAPTVLEAAAVVGPNPRTAGPGGCRRSPARDHS